MQARHQDNVTDGGGRNKFRGRGGHEKFIYVNSRVWIKRKRWRPKKKVFSSKIFTNSGFRFKIFAIFNKF